MVLKKIGVKIPDMCLTVVWLIYKLLNKVNTGLCGLFSGFEQISRNYSLMNNHHFILTILLL